VSLYTIYITPDTFQEIKNLPGNIKQRRVLIQGIGYDRIASELQAIELDAWAEYTLLKIDADVDQEPIHLLKMTCTLHGIHSCFACSTRNIISARSDLLAKLGNRSRGILAANLIWSE